MTLATLLKQAYYGSNQPASLHFPLCNISMTLQPFVGSWPPFQFLDLFTQSVGDPWTGNQPVSRPLRTHNNTNTE
jgi:hypothetical protein